MEFYSEVVNPLHLRIIKLFMFFFISLFYLTTVILTSYLLYAIYFKPSLLKVNSISTSMKIFFITNFSITAPVVFFDIYMVVFWRLGSILLFYLFNNLILIKNNLKKINFAKINFFNMVL